MGQEHMNTLFECEQNQKKVPKAEKPNKAKSPRYRIGIHIGKKRLIKD